MTVAAPIVSIRDKGRSAADRSGSGLASRERGTQPSQDAAYVDGDGAPESRVCEVQRARIIGAAGYVASEHGGARVTVAEVVLRAGVSRRTFYGLFRDGHECLVATLADALEQARARVLPVWQAEGEWSERLRGSLVALLSFFDEQPVLARLLVVESLVGGNDVLQARSRVVSALADAVAGGAEKVEKGAHVDRLTAEGAVGGVLSLLHARISAGTGETRLTELTGPLMHMILLPYRGGARARQELRRPVPTSPVVSVTRPPFDTDPVKDAGIRLTYRTMRVLCVIADTPGASNRIVGTNAGIADQGQISKLLARLERAGLLTNTSPSFPQGVANAWMLTPQGQRVAQSIRGYP